MTANSVIDLGAGASVLAFATSGGVAWTGGATLMVSNWNGSCSGGGAERVVFGSNAAGLAAAQVSQIRFINPPGFPAGSYAATILSTGEVVPFTAPPGISSQPQDRMAVVGDTVSFTCAATGTPVPACQWRLNGAALPGATTSSLLLTNITPSQAGSYSLAASSFIGSTNSRNALLTVYPSAAPTLGGAGLTGNGQFQLNLTGVPGYPYAILASTDLINWTVLQITNSPFTFTDTNINSSPRRFYRAQYQH